MLGYKPPDLSADLREFSPEDGDIAVEEICVDTQPPLDEQTVLRLMEDIDRGCLLQRIGVQGKRTPEPPLYFDLVWGRHRLEAFRRLLANAIATGDDQRIFRFKQIPVRLFKAETPGQWIVYFKSAERIHQAQGCPEVRKVCDVRPMALNSIIYGDDADADLVESVRTKGILTPLTITHDDRVISGHRRLKAAEQAGLATVPVVVFSSRDELDITEALVESNRQRVKTNEQIAREYDLLKTVLHERQSRQGQRTDLEDDGETSREISLEVQAPNEQAAAAIGKDRRTLDKASAVVKVIDKMTEDGNAEAATDLRDKLNASVHGAYKEARAAGTITPKKRPSRSKAPTPEQVLANLITLLKKPGADPCVHKSNYVPGERYSISVQVESQQCGATLDASWDVDFTPLAEIIRPMLVGYEKDKFEWFMKEALEAAQARATSSVVSGASAPSTTVDKPSVDAPGQQYLFPEQAVVAEETPYRMQAEIAATIAEPGPCLVEACPEPEATEHPEPVHLPVVPNLPAESGSRRTEIITPACTVLGSVEWLQATACLAKRWSGLVGTYIRELMKYLPSLKEHDWRLLIDGEDNWPRFCREILNVEPAFLEAIEQAAQHLTEKGK